MKAIVVSKLGGPEVLAYQEVDKPSVGPNQVMIRTKALSVNFADIKARKGKYHRGSEPPFVPGLEVAGTIEGVGPEVEKFHEGQRVIAFVDGGSYAEYAVANENLTFMIPDSLDFETAAACPLVSFVSYHLLHEVGRLQPGETVLVHASAGGVGTTAVQMAKILGAGQIIGTVGSDKKKDTSRQVGADKVINYEKEDFVKPVLQLTDGKGADLILDSVAGGIGERSLACLAPYGRLVNFGNASGWPANFQTKDLHSSCRAVLGFSLGTTRSQRPELLQPTAEKVLPYLADGRLKMVIGKRLPLSEARAAHEWIESRQSTGKVILLP